MADLSSQSWILALGLLLACAPSSEEVRGSEAAVNGPADTEGTWSGVLGMQITKPRGVASCTGVLIAPNLVLTARHCVSETSPALICGSAPLSEPVDPGGILSTNDVIVQEDSLAVRAIRVEVPPDGNDECGFDIAAVILAAEVPDSEFYPPRLDRPATSGETFTAVGYGTSSTGGIGTRRVLGDVPVVCVGEGCMIPEVQDTEWVGGNDAFCRSDSGAPAIDADGQVIGVVSKGINPCSTPVLSSLHAWRDWLQGVGQRAAETGGYSPPSWAMPELPDAGVDAGTDAGVDAGVDAGTDAGADAGADDAGAADSGPLVVPFLEDEGCSVSFSRGSPSPHGVWLVLALLFAWRRRVRNT